MRLADGLGVPRVGINLNGRDSSVSVLVRATEYARLARQHPSVVEVGFDDFWAFVQKMREDYPAQHLTQIMSAAKGAGLPFAVTVYEDQISAIEQSPKTPASVRAMVGRVALYMHHRASVTHYKADVAHAKRVFPNAKVYAGVYHYDRQDYLPCRNGERAKCSDAEEMALFEEALRVQIGLYRAGVVDGLELYPGRLGQEAKLAMWDTPRICAPSRKAKCIATSERMGRMLVDTLRR